MRWRTVLVIFRKEVLDTFRDRRTLIAMVGVPLILYPALFVFGSQAAMMQFERLESERSKVAVMGESRARVETWLMSDERLEVVSPAEPEKQLAGGAIDAVVVVPDSLDDLLERRETVDITIQFDAAEPYSQAAAARVAETLEQQRQRLLEERLSAAGLPKTFAVPLSIERKNVAPPSKAAGAVLGLMLPLVMIVMVGIGAFYPAIDLTAGEKERGTFETLLSTPTQSLEILTGKFLTVFCVAMVTGLMNLGSMVATLGFQLVQLRNDIGEYAIHLPPHAIALIFIALLPLAFLIAAVMMTVAVFARSFREAQTFLTPVLLLILFPAAIASIPGTSLTPATQLVPITGFALLFKDLMTDEVSPVSAAAVLFSTTAYAVLALVVAARVFQREDVVLATDGAVSFGFRRSNYRPRPLPTAGMSLFILSLSLLLYFYIGTVLQNSHGLLGLALSQVFLFLLPPVLVLWYVRVDLVSSLSLRAPVPASLLAGMLMGAGWVVLNLQISVLQERLWPFPDDLAKEMARLLQLDQAPVAVLVLVLALAPAVCEEVLFRGAMLSGLRRHLRPWVLFLVVGAAFALAHMSIHRFPLTMLSGMVLTYLVWRAGSLYPGVLAHFIVNATSILINARQMPAPVLEITDAALEQELGFPWWVLGAAAVLFAAGVTLLERTPRRDPATHAGLSAE